MIKIFIGKLLRKEKTFLVSKFLILYVLMRNVVTIHARTTTMVTMVEINDNYMIVMIICHVKSFQRGKAVPLFHLQSQVFSKQQRYDTHENTQWRPTIQVGITIILLAIIIREALM